MYSLQFHLTLYGVIFILHHVQSTTRNVYPTISYANNTERNVQHKASSTVSVFFDLSRVKSMNDSQLELNYKSIILTMRREGRGVLKYFQSDLIKMIFSEHHNETERAVRERWHEQCDFMLEHDDVDHFKTYMIGADDTLIDGTNINAGQLNEENDSKQEQKLEEQQKFQQQHEDQQQI